MHLPSPFLWIEENVLGSHPVNFFDIVYHSGTPGACKIKNKGRDFIDQGGYENQELMRRLHAEKAEAKEELEFQQLRSVIATNNATQRAYNIQKKQNRTSLLLVGVASILFLGTLLKEVFDSPPLDTETKQLLLMHAKNQDSLKQVLQSIDSTFRAFTDSANKNSSRQ